jgi:hypothetical protein
LQFKTLQTKATNSLSLKGLLLIAQFNFQRAAGCFHPKILPVNFESTSPSGEQKAECRFTIFQLGISDSSIRSAEIISTAPTVNLVFVFQSSAALPAVDEQSIRSPFARKSILKKISGDFYQ